MGTQLDLLTERTKIRPMVKGRSQYKSYAITVRYLRSVADPGRIRIQPGLWIRGRQEKLKNKNL